MKVLFLKYYPWIPLPLLCVYYLCQIVNFPIHDFSNYYFGAKFLASGNFNAAIYFPFDFNKNIALMGYRNLFASYAPNTPFLSLLFYPLGFLPVLVSKLVFTLLSTVLFMYSLKKLSAFYQLPSQVFLLVPVLFFIPLKNELLFGQVYFLLFFFLSESLLAYEKTNYKTMAFFLGLAIALKVFPVLLLSLFVFKKEFKPLLLSLFFTLTFIVFTLPFVGIDIWFFYIEKVLLKASNGEITTAFVDNYQSPLMFLKRCFVYEAYENPNPFLNNPMLFFGLVFTLKITVVTLGYFITRRINDTFMAYCYWILSMILLSPYGSTYTFILLIFPFLFILKSTISERKKWVFFAILFLINNVPLAFFLNRPFPFSFLRLMFLMMLFLMLLWMVRRKIDFRKTLLISGLALSFALIMKKNDNDHASLLLEQPPILIYDYSLSDNRLSYHYFDEHGSHVKSVAYPSETCEKLKIKDHQIFLNGKALTNDNSNKIMPVLLNRSTLIYLSDFDRGIGFYTLRTIDLKLADPLKQREIEH